MEVAIPGIALGIMYILSNKDKTPESYDENENYIYNNIFFNSWVLPSVSHNCWREESTYKAK